MKENNKDNITTIGNINNLPTTIVKLNKKITYLLPSIKYYPFCGDRLLISSYK